MPEDANPRLDTYFVWEPPNRLITILLNLRLLDRLKLWMDKGLQAGEEVGGILLGRVEEDTSGDVVVTVEDCETVQIGHQRGPTYTLNDKDKARIEKRIAWWQANGQSRTPVGLVRSHIRSGLYLDAADFAVFQHSFPDSRSVFLLARPGDDATGGFFFWEEGDVHRQTTYAPFPFDREKLEADGHTILGSARPVVARTLTMPAKEKQPIKRRPSQLVKLRPSGWAWLAAAAIVLVLMAAGLYWTGSSRVAPTAASAGFGLNIDHLGRALRLTWDPRAPAIAHAGQAVLSIRDGANQREQMLNSRQLSHGSALYVPASDDVEFRLQIRKGGREFADSIRSVAPALKPVPAGDTQAASSTAANPVPSPAESPDRIVPKQHPNPVEAEENRPMPSQTMQARRKKGSADRTQTLVATVAERSRVEATPVVPPPPLETPKVEPAPPPPVEAEARPLRRPIPTVSVNYEAAPESALRRKIQKVPMLRLLQHNQYRGGDNFAPARPIREVRPQLIRSIVQALPGEWRVELKVSLDKHGRVSEVESLSTEADERLVTAAVSAVRESRFEPAQLNGRDVSSRLLVTYHFRNPPQPAMTARTAPE